jgi:hypothetical protein
MKPIDNESSIGVDRFATWNEVMCAISVSVRDTDDLLEAEACNLTEGDMWLAMAREMPDSKSN